MEKELKCDDCDDDMVAICVECKLYQCQDCKRVHSKKNKTHRVLALNSEGSTGGTAPVDPKAAASNTTSPKPAEVVNRNYQDINKPNKILKDDIGRPWGIAFGKDGFWAVADGLNNSVHIFDDKDELVRTIGCSGSNNGQFKNPRGVAFDSEDRLYVVDYGNHRVQKFEITGNYLLQFGTKGECNGELDGPCGVTVHNDKVYVADYNNKRISVFQSDGKFCTSFDSDDLRRPTDVAINANNQLLVADDDTCCIYIFGLEGHQVGKFGAPGSGKNQLNGPYAINTDQNGFILVADTGNSRVSIFNKDNRCVHSFGSYGSGAGQFYRPRGVAVGPNGNVYVGDTESSKKIQIF